MKVGQALGAMGCLVLVTSQALADEAPPSTPGASGATETAPAPTAGAEPAASRASQAPPKIDLKVEEPPPPVARSYHVHDGFYLRVSLGVGALGNDYDLGAVSAESHGGTLALDVLVGGTPSKGLVLGGALFNEAGVSHGVERGGRSLGDANVRLSLIGPFVDGFFDPKGGFHLGGAVGFAALALEDLGVEDETDTLTGFGGAAWAGYDAWVADEWAIGGLVRAGAAITKKSDDAGDLTASSFSLGLMLTVLHH
jgi:hypothetical protein